MINTGYALGQLLIVVSRQALHSATTTVRCVAESTSYRFEAAASGGADLADSIVSLACPLTPDPLAARGLTAVLARAGAAGGDWSPGCS